MLSIKTQKLLLAIQKAVGISYTEPSQKLTSPKRIEALEARLHLLEESVGELQQRRGPGRPRKEEKAA